MAALSAEQVRRRLNVEEPDYAALARELGPDAGPHLRTLVSDGDEGIAAKAAFLASLLPGQAATVALAARSANPVVRLAAASGAANVDEPSVVEPLHHLLEDADVGVRKTALRSAVRRQDADLRPLIQLLEQEDPEVVIKQLARRALAQWPEPD